VLRGGIRRTGESRSKQAYELSRVSFRRHAECAEKDVKLAGREIESVCALRALMQGPGALLGVALAQPCATTLRQLPRAVGAQEPDPFGHLEQDAEQEVWSDSVQARERHEAAEARQAVDSRARRHTRRLGRLVVHGTDPAGDEAVIRSAIARAAVAKRDARGTNPDPPAAHNPSGMKSRASISADCPQSSRFGHNPSGIYCLC
jgi:hypothetical protein